MEELIIRDFPKVDKNEPMSKVVALLREYHNVKGVVVFDGEKYFGVITEKNIIRTRFNLEEKAEKLALRIKPLKVGFDPSEAALKMVESGTRVIPVEEDGKIIGIVTAYKLLEYFKDKLKDVKVKEIMVEDVITISPNAKISKAITIMRKKNVSRLPVVEDGRVVGIITVRDIIEKVIYPKERATVGEKGEAYPSLAMPVSAIMTTNVITVSPDDSLKDLIEKFLRFNISGCPVVKDGRLVGIVTKRDVLEFISRKKEVRFVLSISGIDLDDLDKQWIYEQIENKIIRKYKEVLGEDIHVYIYIKKIRETVEQDRTMRFFNVKIRLYGKKMYYASEEGWDLYSTIRNAIDILEEQLEEEKGRRLEYEPVELL